MRRWPDEPRVYEINTRVWLTELSQRDGQRLTLAQVPDKDIEAIAARGFDAVWLMGVWTVGVSPIGISRTSARLAELRKTLPDLTIADAIGSPYAVSDYQVDKTLGGDAALRTLRERLARRGLGLVLDFVPNHTACDHPLVLTHPTAFIGGTPDDLAREPDAFFKTPSGAVIAHGKDPYFPAWIDTAQVHYGRPAARQAMMQTLARIAERCDGVRCDMAMLLLPDVMEKTWGSRLGPQWIRKSFWGEAIANVRARRADFLFLAEVYWGLESRLRAEGFDFAYDKSLYDRLREGDVAGVRRHLSRPLEVQSYDARFVENHDETRAAQQFGARARAAAVVTFLSPGFKLFHEGQLEGWKVRLPIQLRRRPPEPADPETAAFYARLLEILRDDAFRNGSFALVLTRPASPDDRSHETMVAFFRRAEPAGSTIGWLVVTNLGAARSQARLRVPAPLETARDYVFHDRLADVRYDRKGAELTSEGLYVGLEPYASHVFEIRPE
jgi:hypothetical protein